MNYLDFNVENTKEFGNIHRDKMIKICEFEGLEYVGYSNRINQIQIMGISKDKDNDKEQTLTMDYNKFENYFPLSEKEIENLIIELSEQKGKLDMSLIGEFNKVYKEKSFDGKMVVNVVKKLINN